MSLPSEQKNNKTKMKNKEEQQQGGTDAENNVEERREQEFEIFGLSITRAQLENMEYDIAEVSDETMYELAAVIQYVFEDALAGYLDAAAGEAGIPMR